jgi:DNA-binding MarR family transcriptional regulator
MTAPNKHDSKINPEQHSAEILALMGQVAHRFGPEADEMSAWLAERNEDPTIAKVLPEMTLTMWRALGAIGQLGPVNGATISKQFGMPKGSVSKATRRLVANKLVESQPLPNNKKEVLFLLTPLGQKLYAAHQAFDAQMIRGFNRFIQRYDADDQSLMVKVLQDVLETSFLKLGGLQE